MSAFWVPKNNKELHKKAIDLYRSTIKLLPRLIKMYGLTDMNETEMRSIVRQKFYDAATMKDPKVINLHIHKGEQIVREAIEGWYSPMHMFHYFSKQAPAIPAKRIATDSNFLDEFYKGSQKRL